MVKVIYSKDERKRLIEAGRSDNQIKDLLSRSQSIIEEAIDDEIMIATANTNAIIAKVKKSSSKGSD